MPLQGLSPTDRVSTLGIIYATDHLCPGLNAGIV